MRDTKTPYYYEVLRVAPNATKGEIKAQYRLLSKRRHPDTGGSQAEMTELNEAYAVLSDPFRRSIYDAERRRAVKVPPRAPHQPIYAASRRQPTPRAKPQFVRHAKPKRRTSWWSRLAWGFAVLALAIGLISQLPIVQAAPEGTTTAIQEATSSPSPAVTYESGSSPAASGMGSGSPATTPDPSANTQPSAQSIGACDNASTTTAGCDISQKSCSTDSCQESQPSKSCTPLELYKRIPCNYKHAKCASNPSAKHYGLCY